ncbi:hypothetical protein Q4602_00985 [Paraglaciecola chathamensis]|uniref:hypothetical protein n=1 Tax=Paraglaciecola chathamensis TaxID=368405 RepID=UPI0026FF7197|nr:hypothetical protein [Paraglaciecola chathamensis]MDO6838034.1 hypothetical protein [Paraglaciecola chathamensis]
MAEELNRLKLQLRESHLYIEKMMTNSTKKAKLSGGKQSKSEIELTKTVDSESHILIDHAESGRTSQFYISKIQSNFIGKLLWFVLFEIQNKSLKKEHGIIQESGLFDSSWYLTKYPECSVFKMTPIMHYVKYGWREGKNPSVGFDTSWYLNTNSDIKAVGVNPLIHYILFGKSEGRSPRKK